MFKAWSLIESKSVYRDWRKTDRLTRKLMAMLQPRNKSDRSDVKRKKKENKLIIIVNCVQTTKTLQNAHN